MSVCAQVRMRSRRRRALPGRPKVRHLVLRLADGRLGLALVFAAALASFAVQSFVWPLAAGRDWQDYLLYWYELREAEPLFPVLMLARTPLAPLFFGPLFELGGAHLAEVGAAALFAGAVVFWVAAARRFGRLVAVAMAALLLAVPTYGWFFHQIGSDPVFAFLLALVAWVTLRTSAGPSVAGFAVLGATIASLVLTRPSGQPFLLLALLPLGIPAPWQNRIAWGIACAGTAVLLLGFWAVYNGVRFDDFTVARGARAGIPFYRAFVVDRSVARENGPSSEALARAIERDLLTTEPYRSWGFDADEVLSSGAASVLEDLTTLADRTWGFDDDHRRLFSVGIEAVRAHPWAYASGVLSTAWSLAREPYGGPPGVGAVEPYSPRDGPSDAVLGAPEAGRRLPGRVQQLPSVYAIALVNNWALSPSPRFRVIGGLAPVDGRRWSEFEKRDLVWRSPADGRRYDELRSVVLNGVDQLAKGNRHRGEHILRKLIWLTPPIAFWAAAAALVWLVRRPRGLWPPLLLALASTGVLLATALGFRAEQNYAMPFVPIFILLALAVFARSFAAPLQSARSRE